MLSRNKTSRLMCAAAVSVALVLSVGLTPAAAATYTVVNTNDSGAGSLRQAVADANATLDDDVIGFDATVFATPQTITLTSGALSVTPGGGRLTAPAQTA